MTHKVQKTSNIMSEIPLVKIMITEKEHFISDMNIS